MRWFVEVATLSAGGPATRVTVEAPSWQAALAQARAARSDTTALSNFTIEVLAEGYRATNPATRTRYTVNKAPDDAALGSSDTAPTSAPDSKGPISTPASIAAATLRRPAKTNIAIASSPSAAPIAAPASTLPAANTSTGNGAPAPSAKPDSDAAPNTVAQVKRSEPPRPSGSVSAPPRPASAPPPAGTLPSSSVAAGVAPSPAAPAVQVKPAAQPPPPNAPLEGNVFLRRGEDPGSRSPLTYRELGIAVRPGTSLDRAVSIAHAHLEDVQRTLDGARAPSGRLVALAIFDHEWQSRPERRPLVTLTYKDWKGKPTLSYPGKSVPPPAAKAEPAVAQPAAAPPAPVAAPVAAPSAAASVAPPPAPVTPPPPVAAALTPALSTSASRPRMDAASVAAEIAGAVASSEAAARASTSLPAQAPSGDVPKSVEAVVAPTPSVIIADAAPAPAVPQASAPVVAAPALGRTASGRLDPRNTPAPTSDRPRARPEDLMSEIFESMHDLHFLRDSLEGADFVIELLHQKLPTKVTIVHLYDINSKEFVVVKARSPGGGGVLGTRTSEGSGLVGAAARSGRGIVVDDAAQDERWSRERYQAAGHVPRAIMVVPVRLGQRFLGAIELADHADGKAFGEDVLYAVTYIAEQFAEFVADRGVTLKAGESGAFTALDNKR